MKKRRNDRELADDIVAQLNSKEDNNRYPDMNVRSLLQRARDAGGGPLRMQYLRHAQRAIAKLDPTRYAQTIGRLQGEVLALQGRGGDTEVAHVTPGEIVIPRHLQSPEFISAFVRLARAHGIDPAQFQVGNPHNRINPQTGRSEFYYNGPDIGRDTSANDQPPEQQIADIYVNHFPYEAHGFGHVGIGVNTPQTQGFYPAELGGLTPFGVHVPGVVKSDDLNQPHETLRIPTTPNQDAAVQDYINRRTGNPGDYDLYNRQCTDFVGGGLRAGGVMVPSDSTPDLEDNTIPNSFFPLLKRRYGP